MTPAPSAAAVTLPGPAIAPTARAKLDMRLLGFLFVTGGPLVFVLLALLGFVLVSTFTVSVVLGQAYLPKHPGMASGPIVGFAIGAGGVGASALGWVADHWGLTAALGISAVMPLAGFLVALFLPDPKTGGVG
jgi:MFS transporter, FSR family, fosmidomycin resistance protein